MARFRYKRGERPLEGYTIEHGLGVGGFGEVYYAVSDSGREVALKAVRNFEEIELRGIRHCMNLKSPYLVSIFDVKFNDEEAPFVIMEYVQGPSLRTLLDNAPEGLGPTKAAFFLREIAKGLTHLHDAGVVHRDLKPHNVFYEDGFVKVGDYSLCKLISASHRSGHTTTVGTVHYMAPEISKGRYDASVDIYALGIMLYEMLTGLPPFVGDSMGEVLMKHMVEEPDLSKVHEPFRSTIAKAIAKNPEQRFASAAEMVEAVFGVDHVQNSVIEFNPQELTMVAGKVAKRVLSTPSGRQHPDGSSPNDDSRGKWGKTWKPASNHVSEHGGKVDSGEFVETQLRSEVPQSPSELPAPPRAANYDRNADRMPQRVRFVLAATVAAGISFVATKLLRPHFDSTHPVSLGTMTGICISILIATFAVLYLRKLLPTIRFARSTRERLLIAAPIFAVFFLVILFHAFCVALPFVVLDWTALLKPEREKRLNGLPIAFAFFITLFASSVMFFLFASSVMFFNLPGPFYLRAGFAEFTATIAAGIGLCLQIASPMRGVLANGSPGGQDRHPTGSVVKPRRKTPSESMPVNQFSSVPVSKQWNPVSVSQAVAWGLGVVLFGVAAILAVLSSTAHMQRWDLISIGTASILSSVGFGLTIASLGLMIGSGYRHGKPFVRMVGAIAIMASIHLSVMNMAFESPFAAGIAVAVGLLAWPAHDYERQRLR